MMFSRIKTFFPFLSAIVEKNIRFHMSFISKGYEYLKRTKNINILRNIKNDFTNQIFDGINHGASHFFYGCSLGDAELLTRQYLLQTMAGPDLDKTILHSIGSNYQPITYSLPSIWQDALRKKGIKIHHRISSLEWCLHIVLRWLAGIFICIKLIVISLRKIKAVKHYIKRRYVYFDGLTASNLPQPGRDGRSYDICTWYSLWNGRADDSEALYHGFAGVEPCNVNGFHVDYLSSIFPSLDRASKIFNFFLWSIKAIALSAFDALFGRWWHALLLAEAAKAKYIRLQNPSFLARDYLFPFSGSIYRPMWTYEAEKMGSRIICYFYSTYEQIKLPHGYVSQQFEWGATSWPIYLVWDDFQAELLREEIKKEIKIEIVGPIWFSTSTTELSDIPQKSIAVFDVQPVNPSAHFGITTMADWIAEYPDMHIQFLLDIHTVLLKNNVAMVLKQKRDLPKKRQVEKYMNLVYDLSKSKEVILVDPRVSAIRVIEQCSGVISMPFTSTALYRSDIPSVYYDPTQWIQKDDRGAHGVPILSGKEELNEWVKNIFKRSNSCRER